MNKPSVNLVLLLTSFILGAALGVLGDRTLLATKPVEADDETEFAVATPKAEAPVAQPAPAAPKAEAPVPAPEAEPQVAEAEDDDAPKSEWLPPPPPPPPGGPGRRGRNGFQMPSPMQIAMAKTAWIAAQGPVYVKTAELLCLDEEGVTRLKDVVSGMNERMAESMEVLAANLRDQENIFEPTPELQVRAFGELATIIASTYDEVGAIVPEERRDDVQKVELVRLVDPNAINPVINLMNERMGSQKEGSQQE